MQVQLFPALEGLAAFGARERVAGVEQSAEGRTAANGFNIQNAVERRWGRRAGERGGILLHRLHHVEELKTERSRLRLAGRRRRPSGSEGALSEREHKDRR